MAGSPPALPMLLRVRAPPAPFPASRARSAPTRSRCCDRVVASGSRPSRARRASQAILRCPDRLFRRRPENNQDQLFLYVVKVVDRQGGNKQNRAGPYGVILLSYSNLRAAFDRVVDLVLAVGRLVVRAAGRKDVQPDAEQVATSHPGRIRVRRRPRLRDHVVKLGRLELNTFRCRHRSGLTITGFFGGLICPSTYPAAIM